MAEWLSGCWQSASKLREEYKEFRHQVDNDKQRVSSTAEAERHSTGRGRDTAEAETHSRGREAQHWQRQRGTGSEASAEKQTRREVEAETRREVDVDALVVNCRKAENRGRQIREQICCSS